MPGNPLHDMAEKLERFQTAAYALSLNWAGNLETDAKALAPWRDRTSHARQGIQGTAERGTGTMIAVIYLSHSVRYGVFLESSNKAYTIVPKAKKALFWNGLAHPVKRAFHPARQPIYAVIRPTIERNLDRIGPTFQELLAP
jgi:hypothetical protein